MYNNLIGEDYGELAINVAHWSKTQSQRHTMIKRCIVNECLHILKMLNFTKEEVVNDIQRLMIKLCIH